MTASGRFAPNRLLMRSVNFLRGAPIRVWRGTMTASRRYSESLVRRALEGESESPAQTWVWGASGVR